MKALVTGAAGFVGSHLVDGFLEQGYSVRVIVRQSSDLTYLKTLGDRIEWIFGDLTNPDAVVKATAGVDIILHSAGRVTDYGSREQFVAANCVATTNLLQAAKTNKVSRFIFISSPSIFADDQDHLNMDETAPYPKHFANYYAETKCLSEQEVLAAHSLSLITCSLRPRGIWGPRDKSGFIPKILLSLKKGKLKNLAPGKQVMTSICHVQNLVGACLAAAQSPNVGGQAYFITDHEKLILWDFINELAHTFGFKPVHSAINPLVLKLLVASVELIWTIPALKNQRSPPVSRYGVSLLTQHGTYSLAKAVRDFNYDPKIGTVEGVQGLKNWVNENGGIEEFLKHVS